MPEECRPSGGRLIFNVPLCSANSESDRERDRERERVKLELQDFHRFLKVFMGVGVSGAWFWVLEFGL